MPRNTAPSWRDREREDAQAMLVDKASLEALRLAFDRYQATSREHLDGAVMIEDDDELSIALPLQAYDDYREAADALVALLLDALGIETEDKAEGSS